MAITTSLCNSAKQEFLSGTHASADVYKMLLIKAGATTTYDATLTNVGTPGSGAPSTSNIGTDEATGTGYTTGGVTLSGITYALTSGTGSIDWGDASWPASSISAIGAVIYNSSKSNRALAVFDFGGTITSTAGTFTVTIPSAGTGVIRFA